MMRISAFSVAFIMSVAMTDRKLNNILQTYHNITYHMRVTQVNSIIACHVSISYLNYVEIYKEEALVKQG